MLACTYWYEKDSVEEQEIAAQEKRQAEDQEGHPMEKKM